MATDADILQDAKAELDRAVDAETDNRDAFLEDLRFGRLGDQWPDAIRRERELEGRPCLTINTAPTFIRQVVNDARQNKPAMRFHPVDSQADVETAKIISGLVRSIEAQSKADIAYDTAIDFAVSGGFGYFRIATDYAYDDNFDLDILIERVSNPLLIYGDPDATSADGSDWNTAFVTRIMREDAFEAEYPGADKIDFTGLYADVDAPWREDDHVMVAEWWQREKVDRTILLLSDGTVLSEDDLEMRAEEIALAGLTVENSRETKAHRVKQCILTGAEVLEKNDWPGRWIPIVPVYGDEIDIAGKRHFRSLIRDSIDPMRMRNFWRSMTTELVALAPKAPYVGEEKAFTARPDLWATANRLNHPFLPHKDGTAAPRREAFAGVPAGALNEAMQANDDIKATMGMYDASMGARSNETSGRAILARQREGDVSTFHFIDNLSRSIRHGGMIVLDLIPHIYSTARVIRTLGEDGSETPVEINSPTLEKGRDGEPKVDRDGAVIMRIYDLTTGKYDITVSSGPSFTTRREESATQMIEMIRAFPQAAGIMLDLVAKNLDWPGSEEIAERFKKMLPEQLQDQNSIPPQIKKAMMEAKMAIKKLSQENAELKGSKAVDVRKLDIEAFKAETDRLEAMSEQMTPETMLPIVLQSLQMIINSPDVLPPRSGGRTTPDPGASGMPPPPMGHPAPLPRLN